MTNNPKTNTILVDETQGSFLRGSGQMFLRAEKEIAELPDTPLEIKKDWEVLKIWLKCPDGEIDSETYKKFGLAWQSYLALGISPSAALEKPFASFKETAIKENWRTIPIPPEIKVIFDRMMATDQEIAQKAQASPAKLSRAHTVAMSAASVDPALKDVRDCLQELFDGPLKFKGLFPTVAQTPDFPFPDYKTTVSALRSGKAHLSFGLPNPTAFNAIATSAEKFQHMVGMLAYWLAAPIALVAGAVMSENYWLLLWGILLFPLALFGTHPHYKKAPLFIMVSIVCVFLGITDESATLVSVGAFFALVIGGYSFTRRLYNQVLIGRSLEMESALMFLLGCNYLHLCGEKWSLLWTPAWLKDEAKMQKMERQD